MLNICRAGTTSRTTILIVRRRGEERVQHGQRCERPTIRQKRTKSSGQIRRDLQVFAGKTRKPVNWLAGRGQHRDVDTSI